MTVLENLAVQMSTNFREMLTIAQQYPREEDMPPLVRTQLRLLACESLRIDREIRAIGEVLLALEKAA